jgi:oligopeptide/dipeptide ABC transporter ATP-binding protein
VPSGENFVQAVKGISLTIKKGEIVGLVGESGSGKTLSSLAMGGLLPYPTYGVAATLETGRVAYVFQDPNSALNPALRVQTQLVEAIPDWNSLPRHEQREVAENMLQEVQITAPLRRLRQLPHELSGGMKQRVNIAMGLASRPDLLIADEPTTALDVSVQAEVLQIILNARRDHNLAVLFISHNLAVVGEFCDRILVMYGGRIVEDLPADGLRDNAKHPYTQALLGTIPSLTSSRDTVLPTISGQLLRPGDDCPGCVFSARCAHAFSPCHVEPPPRVHTEDGGSVECWLWMNDEVPAR